MKILNLYAGIGGNRQLWGNKHEVTAIEIDSEIAAEYKRRFPKDRVIVCDAHEYLKEHYKEFNFIWSSPPCPTHSRMRRNHKIKIYPDLKLYEEILFLKHFFKGFWIVENVISYYKPLIKPTIILDRHFFWSNFRISFREFKNINVAKATKEELAAKHKIEIPKVKNARLLLRNCVNPNVAKHILSFILDDKANKKPSK